jgi:orotidine-5'-phosphate decarboxylase
LLVPVEGGSRVVFALDTPSLDGARSLAHALRDSVGMFKIGLELFVEAGPKAVALGREVGVPVFLDLKLCDIPVTVDRAVARAAALGARWLTVHAAGGSAMLERAVARAEREAGSSLEIVAVTVLTSLDDGDLAAAGVTGKVEDQVERLARLAWAAGVRIFVCSPREAARLRRAFGADATLVTPGVRPAAPAAREEPPTSATPGASDIPPGAVDDQKRVLTAAEAIAAGADWVVVGRPIRDAADPVVAARALSHEVDAARSRRAAG